MMVGLYSEIARAPIVAARAFIAERGYGSAADDIRRCRQDILAQGLFKDIVATVQREGIPHFARSHVGHGIGVDGYDPPNIAESSIAIASTFASASTMSRIRCRVSVLPWIVPAMSSGFWKLPPTMLKNDSSSV